MAKAYRLAGFLALMVAFTLSGCSSRRPPGADHVPAPSEGPVTFERPGAMQTRPVGRWVQTGWSELPGWSQDHAAEVVPALRQACNRAAAVWRRPCEAARTLDERDHEAVRRWMVEHLQPWRVEDERGRTEGLLTAYYEPHFEARRVSDREFRSAVHAPPADLNQRRPYWTRQQLDTLEPARMALRDRTLAYLRDPVDLLILQTQGSGRLTLTEPDGRQRSVRLAFAGHNDHPYGSVGRWLVDQGLIRPAQASWAGIREWMRRNPRQAPDAMWANPRVVFFREEPLSDPQLGPKGAQGLPLTPQRSIAVDPRSIPLGTLVWMDSVAADRALGLQRVVVAQDTGNAITGAVRADYFTGWGEEAEQRANRTRQRLHLWVLWPRGASIPER